MSTKAERYQLYKEARNRGLSYPAIAKLYGVNWQAVRASILYQENKEFRERTNKKRQQSKLVAYERKWNVPIKAPIYSVLKQFGYSPREIGSICKVEPNTVRNLLRKSGYD